MAAEGGVILTKCLRDLPDTAALTAHEKLRRDRGRQVVAYGQRANSSKQAGSVGRMIRDLILPVVMKREARLSAHEATAVN